MNKPAQILTRDKITKVEKAAARRYKYHQANSRKCKIRIMFDRFGDEAAAAYARKLEIRQSTYRAWRSDWNMEARGELPAWRREREYRKKQRAKNDLTILDAGGRIVIPKTIRDHLEINKGDELEIRVVKNRMIITKA